MSDKDIRPKVSVIIVNYNSSGLINQCLNSVYELTKDLSFEVIIVDNATENLEKNIVFATRPEVKLLQLKENIGFGRANNAGAALAQGEYFFFLNPDTLLINNAIRILTDFMDAHKGVGVCGGNLHDANNKPAISFRRIAPGFIFEVNELLHLIPEKIIFGKNRIYNHSGKPIKAAQISGADLMIRSELFHTLKGFSPDYFMYYEETDLCTRVYGVGKSIWSVPTAKIIHLEGRTFEHKQSDRKIMLLEQSRAIYYRRNRSRINKSLADITHKFFLKLCVMITKNEDKRGFYKRLLTAFYETSKKE